MTMTQAIWNSMTPAERDKACDLSRLSPQLVGLEQKRVEAVRMSGETVRFYVGRSTGWIPCHLEILRSNSYGGMPAARAYKSVRVIPAPRRRAR